MTSAYKAVLGGWRSSDGKTLMWAIKCDLAQPAARRHGCLPTELRKKKCLALVFPSWCGGYNFRRNGALRWNGRVGSESGTTTEPVEELPPTALSLWWAMTRVNISDVAQVVAGFRIILYSSSSSRLQESEILKVLNERYTYYII